MKTDYVGIDYSLGKVNVDKNGIHYGVISHSEVGQAWYEDNQPYYGKPTCPKCGNVNTVIDYDDEKHEMWEIEPYSCSDYVCEDCEYIFDSQFAFPEEPFSLFFEDDEYLAEQSFDDTDIFIVKSPYFTYCQYCSPCAPGAGYLLNYTDKEIGIKAYCFGHDWFENEKAPYPVYNVKTGELEE